MKYLYIFLILFMHLLSSCAYQVISQPNELATNISTSDTKNIEYPYNWEKKDINLKMLGRILNRQDLPNFESYPIKKISNFKSATLKLDSTPRIDVRIKIRKMYLKGPNFAGNLTVATKGCGTTCQEVYIVDHKSGRVVDSFYNTTTGVVHRLNSNLLILNPPSDIDSSWVKNDERCVLNTACVITTFLLWDGKKFNVLSKDSFYKNLCPRRALIEEPLKNTDGENLSMMQESKAFYKTLINSTPAHNLPLSVQYILQKSHDF